MMKDDDDDNNCNASKNGPVFSPPLYIQRYEFTRDLIKDFEPIITSVADFGCAEGRFLRYLKRMPNIQKVACIDVDDVCLDQCLLEARPLIWDHIFGRSSQLTINVFTGSVSQVDSRLLEFDAVTCIELLEHLKLDDLLKLPHNIFGFIKPKLIIFTTPNCEYNVLFPQLKHQEFRHWDHKFEWTRAEFQSWCDSIVSKYTEYKYELTGVGEAPNGSQHVGFCTQIAVFTKELNDNSNNHNKDENKFSDQLNYTLKDSFHYEEKAEFKYKEIELIDWGTVLSSESK